MKKLTGVYLTDGTDMVEVERGIRLCLQGAWRVPAWNGSREGWGSWMLGSEWKSVARQVVRIYQMAQRGALGEVLAADRELAVGVVAEIPEHVVWPADPDPLRRGVVRALAAGEIPGHWATLCAVGAVSFHLPLLVAMQAALFVEWDVRQVRRESATVALFIESAYPLLLQLPPFLAEHETSSSAKFAIL